MSQGVSLGLPNSEPIPHTLPPIQVQSESIHAPAENQDIPSQQPDQDIPEHSYRRKSAKYWTVNLIDEDGVIKEERLRVADVVGLSRNKKVVLEWNHEGQPVGEAAGLLGGFLGSIAANVTKFPISYEKWLSVPQTYKDHVWDNTIKEKFQVNDNSHKKYIIANIGKKWKDNRVRLFGENYNSSLGWDENLELRPEGISREQWASFLNYRLSDKTRESQTGISYSRGEMYSIAHTKKDGTFVNEEAKQKSDLLDEQIEQMSSEEEAYASVFGKEHPGRVRGMGFGVCPSQVLGPACRFGGSSMPSSCWESSSEIAKLKTELEASNARVEALEQEVAKVRTLEQEVAKVRTMEEQLSFLMQQYGGELPSRADSVEDIHSPMRARPSSHNPKNKGPSTV